jgi:sucrose phosphorylase
VINHISSQSRWFRECLNGNPYYKDFFIAFSSPADLTPEERAQGFRPRTSDLLVRFDTIRGPAYVWATFSADQLDLNYKNPNVLMRVIEVLLLYVRHGADIIRLDAVTYLWSERGTACVHLPQTHEIVKLLRDVLNAVAPGVALITETNVPHDENVSYFGNGHDEAQMVYNFALPPLVLHAFYREDVTILARWAAELDSGSGTATFFNFLDSHDGIGVLGARGVLPKEEIEFVIERAKEHGALISYKTGADGVEEPYELNTTWFSALNREDSDEDLAFQVRRFVASRSVALVLPGVPGIYLHSLMGTVNDFNAVLATDSKRDINRTVIDCAAVTTALQDPFSKTSRMNRELGRLIALRARKRAFHPNGPRKILHLDRRVFAVLRLSPEGDAFVLALTNVSNQACRLEVPLEDLTWGEVRVDAEHVYDAVTGMTWLADNGCLHLSLNPYDVVWLEAFREREKDIAAS